MFENLLTPFCVDCHGPCSHVPVVGYWGYWQFLSINQCYNGIFLPLFWACVSAEVIHTPLSHLYDQHGRPQPGKVLVSCYIMGAPDQEATGMRVFQYFSNNMSKSASSG